MAIRVSSPTFPWAGHLVVVLALAWAAACQPQWGTEGLDGTNSGGSSGQGNGGDDEPSRSNGGSCNDWKVAYCDALDRCSFGSREECELDIGYVRCLTEAPFESCAAEIDEADCDEMPDGCDAIHIADRTVPTAACERIYEAICEWGLFCGVELSVEGCRASLDAGQPCGDFTAVLPPVDECVAALGRATCGDPMPAVCSGILRH